MYSQYSEAHCFYDSKVNFAILTCLFLLAYMKIGCRDCHTTIFEQNIITSNIHMLRAEGMLTSLVMF